MNFLVPSPSKEYLNYVYITWKKSIKSDVDIKYLKSNYYLLGCPFKIRFRIKQFIKKKLINKPYGKIK